MLGRGASELSACASLAVILMTTPTIQATHVTGKLRRLPRAAARRVKRLAYYLHLQACRARLALSLEWAILRDKVHPETGPSDKLFLFDTWFPTLLYPYRITEYHAIFEAHPNSEMHSSFAPAPDGFHQALKEYRQHYPQYSRRIRKFHPRRPLHGSSAYVLFLCMTMEFLDTIEEAGLPFAFTLYPGGEFRLDQPESDAMLQRVLSSPLFRRVIVTQPVTRDYLLRKGFCAEDQIEYVFGVVIPPERLKLEPLPRLRYGIDKPELDICFVAHKYMPGGIDKGYDRFVATARLLRAQYSQIRFHVVGPYGPDDADVSELGDSLVFYGMQLPDFFPAFYAKMDMIVSPNIPFTLAPGAFDGFPLSTCTEAALCATAVFCTDELAQNQNMFREDEEIVIISPEPEQIYQKIETYLADPERLARIGAKGHRAFLRVYDYDRQMQPRLRVVSAIAQPSASISAPTPSVPQRAR